MQAMEESTSTFLHGGHRITATGDTFSEAETGF